MTAPPQRRPNKAQRAARDEKIFKLKIRGVPERRIAAEVGLSQTRVNQIIEQRAAAQLGPLSEAFAAMRDAELEDLWAQSMRILAESTDADTRLKAINTLRGLNESRRRLHGADAQQPLEVRLEHRLNEESTLTVEAIMTGLKAVSLPQDRLTYALEAAAARLHAIDGREFTPPEPLPPLAVALTPYTEDGQLYIDGPDGLRYRVVAVEPQGAPAVTRLALPPGRADRGPEPDSADAVLAELVKIQNEFGDLLDEEDDDEPEDDQATVA
ncbi:hypothetical protein [Streptomyces sp. NBC_01092]|uniref:hypothetical protein n=1 Tax=Streptomyces sp. NBC_01092 TaxID=2903748 RepID=UPI00386E5908|nr:hypothetical protein OG254_38130 [Streptomyces sp. NBC_01092]